MCLIYDRCHKTAVFLACRQNVFNLNLVLTFFLGLVTSFVVSIPVGPVNMAVFQATLNRSRSYGFAIGFGAILAEAIYCSIPLFGVSSMNEEHVFFDVLYLIFVPILFFLGIYSLKNRKKGIEVDTSIPDSMKPIKKPQKARDTKLGHVVYGFILCASNPMTFFFWVQATIFLNKNDWVDGTTPTLVAFFLGVPVGTWVLYAAFAQLAHITRRRISPALREKLNIFIGVVFLVLSVYLLLTFLDHKHIIDVGL